MFQLKSGDPLKLKIAETYEIETIKDDKELTDCQEYLLNLHYTGYTVFDNIISILHSIRGNRGSVFGHRDRWF